MDHLSSAPDARVRGPRREVCHVAPQSSTAVCHDQRRHPARGFGTTHPDPPPLEGAQHVRVADPAQSALEVQAMAQDDRLPDSVLGSAYCTQMGRMEHGTASLHSREVSHSNPVPARLQRSNPNCVLSQRRS